MSENVNAEIIAIGTEILLGEITDTNSVFIARNLRDLGINVYFMTSVGDNVDRIANAISSALVRADVVITCGGLGPTVDDMTRQAVALATERELEFQQPLMDQIAKRFDGYKIKMTENNRRQAYLPQGATVIENPVGSAPSFVVEHNGGSVISLPGVPREMKFLMLEKVIPYLRQRYSLGIIKARVLKTAGIGESSLDDLIGDELLQASNPTIGLAAHHGQVDVRITAKAETEMDADLMIAQMEQAIRQRANEFIFGADEDELQDVFVHLLQSTDATLSILQAGIPDVFTPLLKSTSGGESVLRTIENLPHPDDVREAFGISAETPLREMARQVAEAISNKSGATIGIVAISYPDDGDEGDNAERSTIAVYSPIKQQDRVYGFGGQSDIAREWVTRWAMSSAWRMLKEMINSEATF
jgi:nicotinamide-nucleotide amidase